MQQTDLKKHFDLFSSNQNKVINEFKKSIHDNIFFINIDSLQSNSKFITFDVEKWSQRPDVFCNDYYKNSSYYQILLLVNNIKTIFNFTPEAVKNRIIIAPTEAAIIKLLSLI